MLHLAPSLVVSLFDQETVILESVNRFSRSSCDAGELSQNGKPKGKDIPSLLQLICLLLRGLRATILGNGRRVNHRRGWWFVMTAAFRFHTGSPRTLSPTGNPNAFVAALNTTALVAMGLSLIALLTSAMRVPGLSVG